MPGERGEGGFFKKLFGGSDKKEEKRPEAETTMIPARVQIDGRWQNVDLLNPQECPDIGFKGWAESQPETQGVPIPWDTIDLSKPEQRRDFIKRFIESSWTQKNA